MVISRSDLKRKRSKECAGLTHIAETPKRTKVHAQRKFAQGSNLVNSPVTISPVKDSIEVPQLNGKDASPDAATVAETAKAPRPNTDDFLTFLCFRGTQILPPALNFFANSVSALRKPPDPAPKRPKAPVPEPDAKAVNPAQPFIAFGVRKRADPFVNGKLEKKRRHALAVQALRRKYQEQRMAKIRSVTINHQQEKTSSITRSQNVASSAASASAKSATSSAAPAKAPVVAATERKTVFRKQQVVRSAKIQNVQLQNRRISRATANSITRSKTVTSAVTKGVKTAVQRKQQRMCLRSGGGAPNAARFIHRELVKTVKKRRILKTTTVTKQSGTVTRTRRLILEATERRRRKTEPEASDFDSDDDKPLVKTVKRIKTVAVKTKPAVKPVVKKVTPVKAPVVKKQPPAVKVVQEMVQEQQQQQNVQRPTRKTKEAAAIYMEILGHKLTVNDTEIDEDDVSIDSFPELPNVRKTEQREIELKKLNKQKKPAILKKRLNPAVAKTVTKVVESEERRTRSSKPILDQAPIRVELKTKKKTILRTSAILKKFPIANKTAVKMPVKKKVPVKDKLEQSFSDSDEEPLSKLTTKRRILMRRSKIGGVFGGKTMLPSLKLAKKRLAFAKKKQQQKKQKQEPKVQAKAKAAPKKVVEVEEVKADEQPKEDTSRKTRNDTRIPEEKPVQAEPTVVPPQTRNKVILPEPALKKIATIEVPVPVPAPAPAAVTKAAPPIMISSDDEEKAFRGFCKTEDVIVKVDLPIPKVPEKVVAPVATISCADLLCKDVGRRFGKGKVNMSTEQIEKWIKDSALAGMKSMKKEEEEEEEDDLLKFEADVPIVIKETPPPPPPPLELPRKEVLKSSVSETIKEVATAATAAVATKPIQNKDEKKSIFNHSQRRSLLRKPEPVKNVNAFSVQNESSVYAFEADTMDEPPVSTPFRRPSRRPSSTTTSKSEDEQKSSTNISGRRPEDLLQSTSSVDTSTPLKRPDAQSSSKFTRLPPPLFTPASVMCPPKTTPGKNVHKTHLELSPDAPASSPSASSMSSASAAASRASRNLLKGMEASGKHSNSKPQPFKRSSSFPKAASAAAEAPAADVSHLTEAPTFYPTEKEFQDPVEYIAKIRGTAERFGICRIVPPANFKPECKVSDDMRFTAYNQYVHKMMYRWGPNFKELMAIKKYLATQSITLTQPPWIGGMEIDLPRLYQTVQTLGGLKEVIEKKKWPKVAEGMKIPKSAQDRVTKLDDIYCKYLLPYDTLSPAEREKLFDQVETEWAKRESKSLLRSQQQQQPQQAATEEEDDEESSSDEGDEECITKGRSMALNAFYRIARNTMSMWFKVPDPQAQDVEAEFWRHVTQRNSHLCVHAGSIDCGSWGYGFACTKNSPFARHAWNLKVLTNNSGNVLRSMGPLMGVTVPTLHVGMVFSAVCWYRDPHALPWIEYLHTGAPKIWYGVSAGQSSQFREALVKLVPSYCRANKKLWLSSDTAMVPPSLLVENGVALCRTVQEPGQFIVVFPKAFTSSLCTGYLVSESVYFAPPVWLQTAEEVFADIRDSCEPSMFSLTRLMISLANDSRTNVNVLKCLVAKLEALIKSEQESRAKLEELGLKDLEKLPTPEMGGRGKKKKKKQQQADGEFVECEVCRMTLFVSMVTNPEEETDYCLEHALEYLQKNPNQAKNCKILFTYDAKELTELISKVEQTIESKMTKKTPGKYQGMPTLLK